VKIYWNPVKLHWMASATALKFPVAPGSLELAKRVDSGSMSTHRHFLPGQDA